MSEAELKKMIEVWMEIAEKLGYYVSPLTVAQKAQLQAFIQRVPEGDAEAILRHCLGDWAGFTNYAKRMQGAYPRPDKPQVGFVLKCTDSCVNFWLQATKEEDDKPITGDGDIEVINFDY